MQGTIGFRVQCLGFRPLGDNLQGFFFGFLRSPIFWHFFSQVSGFNGQPSEVPKDVLFLSVAEASHKGL